MTILDQVTYTPTSSDANDHPFTYIVMVDQEAYQKRQKDSSSIALANVVDSFEILRYELPGKSGKMVKPSDKELKDVFGTSNDVSVVEKILAEGSLHKTMEEVNDWKGGVE